MNKFTEKKYFIGIDISKDKLDLALLDQSTYGVFKDQKVENSLNGYEDIRKWLTKQKVKLADCLFCMEHTGTYGLLLFGWLSQMGIDYCVEPGLKIKRSLGMTRGKNDKVDARRIADYAYTKKTKLIPFNLPSGLILKIKQLLTYRGQLVKINTSLKNSIKSHQQYQRLSGLNNIYDEITDQIDEYEDRVARVDKQISELIKSDESLRKNYELATSVRGIGFVIASFMLVTTNNFTSFDNGRKFACYCGIAPFENTSGTRIKGKKQVSHLANKTMKSLLSNGANSAFNHDPEIKAYYTRKVAEGKNHKLVINAICCKLVNRVFAVIKRKTPYVQTYQQNFC